MLYTMLIFLDFDLARNIYLFKKVGENLVSTKF